MGHEFIEVLCGKLAARPSREPGPRRRIAFGKTFAGLVRLLEKPDTTEAFDQLRKVQTTPLANLIAFMEIYNLRFGRPRPPATAIYRELFTPIDALRDQVVKGLRPDKRTGEPWAIPIPSSTSSVSSSEAKPASRERIRQLGFPEHKKQRTHSKRHQKGWQCRTQECDCAGLFFFATAIKLQKEHASDR